jgi:hypothetical protein
MVEYIEVDAVRQGGMGNGFYKGSGYRLTPYVFSNSPNPERISFRKNWKAPGWQITAASVRTVSGTVHTPLFPDPL